MNFNRIIIAGNLTREPQLSYTPSNTAIVDIGLAVNREWSKDGQKQKETCFVNCVGFGKTAENINKYCKKGDPLLVEGRLTQDNWKDKDTGANRSKLKVTIEGFQFVATGEKKAEPEQKPEDDLEIPF